jgi:hypothetical protein
VVAEKMRADGEVYITVGARGGARGIRTPDLLTAGQALSQLSYGPREFVLSGEV